MSPLNISLADLIARLDAELVAASDLDRISEAQLRAHTLADLGDQLVGHYVGQAKQAGASWTQIGEAIGVSKQAAQQRWVPTPFDRYTRRARHAIVLAQEAARARKHHHIGTEHLLLGLIGEPEGVGALALVDLAGSASAVSDAVDGRLEPGTENSPAKIPFTPQSKEVLEQSIIQAKALDHNFVGTEHLLLALLAVEEGVAAIVLAELNVDLPTARAKVVEILADVTSRFRQA
jgi:hypothetical protein